MAESCRRTAALEFSVHCDLFETPTARLADILLPVSSPFEREGLKIGFDVAEAAREHIQLRPAMVALAGDVRSDAEIVCALARRLALSDTLLPGGVEAGWRHMLPYTPTIAHTLRSFA
jgi:anaerobic selenocysteine-containing dehydrogenase